MKNKRVLGVAVLLLVLFIAPIVGLIFFSRPNRYLYSGVGGVNPLGGTSTANVFVTPTSVINDYSAQPVGSTFTVYINVSSVTDLYTCQLNLTWNHAVLNVTRIVAGDLLLRTTSSSKTASYQLGWVINQTTNINGYSGMSDSILGSVSGVSGSGRLFSVQFKVIGYGTSAITLSTVGNLKTTLLNSTGGAIPFTTANGYFKNKLSGDSNGDGLVNINDMGTLSGHWTGAPGALPYNRDIDNNDDGIININDMGITSGNWGRHYP